MTRSLCATVLLWAVAAAPAIAQLYVPPPDREVEYSPYLQEDFPNQVFFGDTHLHTAGDKP